MDIQFGSRFFTTTNPAAVALTRNPCPPQHFEAVSSAFLSPFCTETASFPRPFLTHGFPPQSTSTCLLSSSIFSLSGWPSQARNPQRLEEDWLAVEVLKPEPLKSYCCHSSWVGVEGKTSQTCQEAILIVMREQKTPRQSVSGCPPGASIHHLQNISGRDTSCIFSLFEELATNHTLYWQSDLCILRRFSWL